MYLRKARLHRHLTQFDIASHLGITTRQYQRIEAGQAFLTHQRLNKLEDLYNLPQRVLFARYLSDIPEYQRYLVSNFFGTDV